MARQQSHPARAHSESPLVVNVTRLGRRPGAMFPLRKTVDNPNRIGLDLIGIAAGAPLKLDLRVESVSEGVLVSGHVWEGPSLKQLAFKPYVMYAGAGQGHVIAFTEDPNFRAITDSANRLLLNAVLLGPAH